MLTGVASATYRRELDEYLDVHHRLYRAVAAVSGADVVVDASKSTAQLFALRRIRGLDLRVVNLVRDSRGVANSWSKSGIVKPQSQDGDTDGDLRPAPAGGALGRAPAGVRRAAGGRAVLARGCGTRTWWPGPGPRSSGPCSEVGLPPADGALDHVGERSVHLDPSHGVAGSRTRFTAGRIELAARRRVAVDALPAGARRVVTAVTLPQLVGYGYVGRATATTPDRGRLMATTYERPAGSSRPRGATGTALPQARLAARRAVPRVPGLVGARARPADLLRDGRSPMAVILRKKGIAAGPARVRALAAVPGLDARGSLPGPGRRPETVPGGGHRPRLRLRRLGRLVRRDHDRDALRGEHRARAADAADRPAAGLDVRGHRRRSGCWPCSAPTLEFQSPVELVLPRSAGVDQLRPHPGPPLAVVDQRLPGLRAAAADRAVPLLERLGQQPGALPAVLHPGLLRHGTPAGARRSARSCWSPRSSRSSSRSTAACGSRSRSPRCTPPSASPSTAAPGPSRRWSRRCSSAASSSCPRRSTTPSCCASRPRTATTAAPAPRRRSSRSPPRGRRSSATAPRAPCRAASARWPAARPEQCHQCAAPPLGTQGFMWRLVLTTGFVGTLLCLSFFAIQFLRRARGPSPLDVTTCTVLLDRGALLLRLRLARLGDVHGDDRGRADGPRRPP